MIASVKKNEKDFHPQNYSKTQQCFQISKALFLFLKTLDFSI